MEAEWNNLRIFLKIAPTRNHYALASKLSQFQPPPIDCLKYATPWPDLIFRNYSLGELSDLLASTSSLITLTTLV